MINISQPEYIKISKIYLIDNQLSNTDKMFLGIISNLSNLKYGGCIANNSYYMQILNIKKRQLYKIIEKLKKLEYIEVTHFENKRIISIKQLDIFDI